MCASCCRSAVQQISKVVATAAAVYMKKCNLSNLSEIYAAGIPVLFVLENILLVQRTPITQSFILNEK